MKLSLAALPLRTRPDFETSRALCGLAQNSAHSELTPNFAAQAADTMKITTRSVSRIFLLEKAERKLLKNRLPCPVFAIMEV
ncbi:hypothetical protein ACFQHW_11885 [Lapidilactobacillus achengensis]|uniref:Uncharacterized protein n=1 Tax=Lapidilactobacillus achengensis TaxID=2486000 RepID=A0ABW1UQK4_9LACO|nr:hypothetical protein [Lapidilactobacillus achengensis]